MFLFNLCNLLQGMSARLTLTVIDHTETVSVQTQTTQDAIKLR